MRLISCLTCHYRKSSLFYLNFVDLFIAISKGDGYEAGRLLIERAPQPSPPVIDPEGFMEDIRDLVNENMDNGVFNLSKMEIANVDDVACFVIYRL